jgi:hypothetical protein
MSVNRSLGPGYGLSFRIMTRLPAGQEDISSVPRRPEGRRAVRQPAQPVLHEPHHHLLTDSRDIMVQAATNVRNTTSDFSAQASTIRAAKPRTVTRSACGPVELSVLPHATRANFNNIELQAQMCAINFTVRRACLNDHAVTASDIMAD